jgi:hypothetical protein
MKINAGPSGREVISLQKADPLVVCKCNGELKSFSSTAQRAGKSGESRTIRLHECQVLVHRSLSSSDTVVPVIFLLTIPRYTDRVPLVAISAQLGLNRQYKKTHQFVDLVGMFKPVTKWAAEIKVPSAVPEMVRKAFKVVQTERPDPATLVSRKTLKKCQYHHLFNHYFHRKYMTALPLRRRSLGLRI